MTPVKNVSKCSGWKRRQNIHMLHTTWQVHTNHIPTRTIFIIPVRRTYSQTYTTHISSMSWAGEMFLMEISNFFKLGSEYFNNHGSKDIILKNTEISFKCDPRIIIQDSENAGKTSWILKRTLFHTETTQIDPNLEVDYHHLNLPPNSSTWHSHFDHRTIYKMWPLHSLSATDYREKYRVSLADVRRNTPPALLIHPLSLIKNGR